MTIVCTVVTYSVVLLRLATRYLLGQQLASDDYCIIAAAVCSLINLVYAAQDSYPADIRRNFRSIWWTM